MLTVAAMSAMGCSFAASDISASFIPHTLATSHRLRKAPSHDVGTFLEAFFLRCGKAPNDPSGKRNDQYDSDNNRGYRPPVIGDPDGVDRHRTDRRIDGRPQGATDQQRGQVSVPSHANHPGGQVDRGLEPNRQKKDHHGGSAHTVQHAIGHTLECGILDYWYGHMM